MTVLLLHWAMGFATLAFALSGIFAAVRLFRGPTAQDRVIGLDALYQSAMLMMLVLGMRFGTQVYFEVSLLIALVGFVGSIAMAKFLLRGEVIE